MDWSQIENCVESLNDLSAYKEQLEKELEKLKHDQQCIAEFLKSVYFAEYLDVEWKKKGGYKPYIMLEEPYIVSIGEKIVAKRKQIEHDLEQIKTLESLKKAGQDLLTNSTVYDLYHG